MGVDLLLVGVGASEGIFNRRAPVLWLLGISVVKEVIVQVGHVNVCIFVKETFQKSYELLIKEGLN